jgi:hypothetical protein
MASVLQDVMPRPNSIYIRSHPGPYTADMELQQERQINLLIAYSMYDGPQQDYLTPGVTHRMHQVHVTGHLNREETRDILSRLKCTIIPYHCMSPQDFIDDVAQHTRVLVPERGERLLL